MDLKTKEKIIAAIKSAPTDEKLSEYLLGVSKVLSKTKYEAKTITLYHSAKAILEEKESPFALKLSGSLSILNDFFFLTQGLHIVGAMSGHGKTFWSMEWAKAAAKEGMSVLVLSLEMTHKDLAARSVSDLAGISLMKIIQRDLTDIQKKLLTGRLEEEDFQYSKNIHIETFGDYDWKKIYPRLWERMLQLRPKLIIVDYIQMISNSEDDERMSQVLSEIARELKLFADQNQAAALVCSQMNREAQRDIRKTKIEEGSAVPLFHSYIKESGGIVEAADSVQLICIPEKLEACPNHLRGTFQITVQKSRRIGLLGTKLIKFDAVNMKFL